MYKLVESLSYVFSLTVVPTPPPEDVAAYKKRGESERRHLSFNEFWKSFVFSLWK